MSAAFKGIMPVLHVTDIDLSIHFYRDLLGFQLVWREANDGEGENCMLESSGLTLMLSTGDHLGGPPAFTGTLYFATVGVAALWETVKDHAQIVWPLENMSYGTLEFGIRDPDGYMLAFAEERA